MRPVDEMTHAELVAEIKRECKQRRLPCYDTQDIARYHVDAAGWPDLVILGRGAALFVEVKKEDSRVSRRQLECGNELAAAGLWYRCWRPSALAAGIIARELDELAAESRRRRPITADDIADLAETRAGFTQEADERLSGGGTIRRGPI
jgi:hypothetical protein